MNPTKTASDQPDASCRMDVSGLEPEHDERLARYLAIPWPLPPSAVDASGRRIPLDDPDYQARRAEYQRRVAELNAQLGDLGEDPPGIEEAFMRGIDEDRDRCGMRTLFEGYY
jgi:hypothetical protein